jgi:hypothetical protein
MQVPDKIICTSRPDCPCQFCGQVRLLMEYVGQRVQVERDTRGIPTHEAVVHALELTGQLEAKRRHQAHIDALALDYITELERRKPQ